MYEIDMDHFSNQNMSVVGARAVFKICGARHNFYMFSLSRIPDQDYQNFGHLLTSMGALPY